MAEKTVYHYSVDPQFVDFTLNATVSSIGDFILNTAGTDAQHKGFGVDVLSKTNRSWVLSRMAIEIDRRPSQYEEFDLRTWVNENSRVISTRNFELVDKSGNIFSRAVTQWCLIDFVKRVPVSLTEIESLCTPFLCDAPSPCALPRKISSVEADTVSEHKVVYSDIDFNCHMNTMRYITRMIDMLPIDLLRENKPLRLDVHFMHECRLGQTLKVGYAQRDNISMFEVTSEDGTVACRATIEWK